MNLKNEIENLENLKNKVRIIKDEINENIVQGGGASSETLSQIPLNIKGLNMVTKKVRYQNFQDQQIAMGNRGEIFLGLNFEPKQLIVQFRNTPQPNSMHTRLLSNILPKRLDPYICNDIIVNFGKDIYYEGAVAEMSSKRFAWETVIPNKNIYIDQIIAIG